MPATVIRIPRGGFILTVECTSDPLMTHSKDQRVVLWLYIYQGSIPQSGQFLKDVNGVLDAYFLIIIYIPLKIDFRKS